MFPLRALITRPQAATMGKASDFPHGSISPKNGTAGAGLFRQAERSPPENRRAPFSRIDACSGGFLLLAGGVIGFDHAHRANLPAFAADDAFFHIDVGGVVGDGDGVGGADLLALAAADATVGCGRPHGSVYPGDKGR